jgi:hypothetical protein
MKIMAKPEEKKAIKGEEVVEKQEEPECFEST